MILILIHTLSQVPGHHCLLLDLCCSGCEYRGDSVVPGRCRSDLKCHIRQLRSSSRVLLNGAEPECSMQQCQFDCHCIKSMRGKCIMLGARNNRDLRVSVFIDRLAFGSVLIFTWLTAAIYYQPSSWPLWFPVRLALTLKRATMLIPVARTASYRKSTLQATVGSGALRQLYVH